jgi:hypothetical protein
MKAAYRPWKGLKNLFQQAARPQQGDSGAWVCALERQRNGLNEYAFCGTFTGVDLDVGYVTFSDSLIAWTGKALKCF